MSYHRSHRLFFWRLLATKNYDSILSSPVRVQKKSFYWSPKNITPKTSYLRHPSMCTSELKNVLEYSCCRQSRASAAKLATAAAIVLLPPRCHRHAVAAYTAAVLPAPPTPCFCQAADSTTKLAPAFNAALLPSCHRRRQAGRCPRAVTALPPPPRFPRHRRPLCFHRYRRCCHRHRFRVFS
jgi:hypothetical protein